MYLSISTYPKGIELGKSLKKSTCIQSWVFTIPAPHVPLEHGSHIIFIDKPYAVLLEDDATGIAITECRGPSKAMKSSFHTGCVKIVLQFSVASITVQRN